MNDEDLNKLRGVVKEEIGTALKPVTEKLDAVWDQTVKLTEEIEELKEDTDALKLEVHDIHKELGAFQDKTISEIDKVKEHVGLPTSINP